MPTPKTLCRTVNNPNLATRSALVFWGHHAKKNRVSPTTDPPMWIIMRRGRGHPMTRVDLRTLTWRKSSDSGWKNDSDCVEVA
jgi:hypothetical protein